MYIYRRYSSSIMEYGSTPYIGMAPKKMAAPLYVYKVLCSTLCPRLSHKLLWDQLKNTIRPAQTLGDGHMQLRTY